MKRKTAAKRRRLAARKAPFEAATIVEAPESIPPPPSPPAAASHRPSFFEAPGFLAPTFRALLTHPILWGIAGLIIFYLWGSTLPAVSWNIEEMMIGRNLLRGNGYVMAPLDPPMLARPPLAPLVCAFVELFTRNPHTIYVVIYVLALSTFMICAFYISKTLWDLKAAHLACFFVLTSPALTARLINHVHSISHVAFLLAAGPAILSTVLAISNPSKFRLALAGFCWGLCYLARWETLLFFPVSLGTACYALYAQRAGRRAAWGLILMLASFLSLFLPYKLFESHSKARYGIWGPSALTTFYASEAYVSLPDPNESEGYKESIRKYGTVESNNNNLFRAIRRNPAAVDARLRVNVPRFLDLFTRREYFDPWWLVFVVLLAIASAWTRRPFLFPIYFVLLFACTTTICLFHIDYRYLTIALPSLLFLICGGFSVFWKAFLAARPIWVKALPMAAVALLCWRVAGASRTELTASLHVPAQRANTMEVARLLAENFRSTVRDTRPWTLTAVLPSEFVDGFIDYLVSYFAGTGIQWASSTSLPYDKIFSQVRKLPDYSYVSEGALTTTDLLSKHRPLSSVKDPVEGAFYLFAGYLPDVRNVTEMSAEEQDELHAVLRQQYPAFVKRYEQYFGIQASLAAVPMTADKVGCGVLAFSGGQPNGRPNRVFKLDFTIREGILTAGGDRSITNIELFRETPWGIFHTSNTHYILGVAKQMNGPLVNDANGGIDVPLAPRTELWLYVCDDGVNHPSSVYRARVQIGHSVWITTPVSRDLASSNRF